MILAAILDAIFVFTCHMTSLTEIHHTCANVLYLKYVKQKNVIKRLAKAKTPAAILKKQPPF